MAAHSEKTKEARLRRQLYRRGYRLEKNRARTLVDTQLGGYMIFDISTNFVAAGQEGGRLYILGLDAVEGWLHS